MIPKKNTKTKLFANIKIEFYPGTKIDSKKCNFLQFPLLLSLNQNDQLPFWSTGSENIYIGLISSVFQFFILEWLFYNIASFYQKNRFPLNIPKMVESNINLNIFQSHYSSYLSQFQQNNAKKSLYHVF